MRSALLAAFLLLAPGAASAGERARTRENGRRTQAHILYRAGIEHYAAGRFPQALASFEAALRRDSGYRAARVAVSRVRSEIAMTATERRDAGWPSARKAPPPAGEETILTRVGRLYAFERTLGDERERLGRALAMQGRIAQLLAERRIARSRHRAFAKDAELHALSRRLA